MSSVFDKLNWKGQTPVLVLNAPPSFERELQSLSGVTIVRDVSGAETVTFAVAFVTKQAEVDALAKAVAPKASGDALLWLAYPKGTSKRYRSEINRDSGWKALRAAGFDTVRQIAIDEDWSALRFRRTEYIGRSGSTR